MWKRIWNSKLTYCFTYCWDEEKCFTRGPAEALDVALAPPGHRAWLNVTEPSIQHAHLQLLPPGRRLRWNPVRIESVHQDHRHAKSLIYINIVTMCCACLNVRWCTCLRVTALETDLTGLLCLPLVLPTSCNDRLSDSQWYDLLKICLIRTVAYRTK